MLASVFIGTSVDGFIARPDGALDFLPADGGEPHGYNEFLASIDALVIGRKTFETVLAFPEWPYGEKPVVVLSSQPLDLSRAPRSVEHMQGSPREIISRLEVQGIRHIYVDGGITIQRFLTRGDDSEASHHAGAGVDWPGHSVVRVAGQGHPVGANSDTALP